MAAYFPRGQQSLVEIKAKFVADAAGVAANAASGMPFVTNQELTIGERQQLRDAVASPLDLFHLERITALLDQPGMEGVREQFLSIPARSNNAIQLRASRRLERFSEVALGDADRIGRDRDRQRQPERASVRLSQQLYVHRPQEELVLAALDDWLRSVLVVGEPGTGKTSLLWRLHSRLLELGAEAYFLRATLLRLGDAPGPGPDAAMLVETAQRAAAAGRRCAMLLDTADARLRDDAERAELLSLLADLVDTGAQLLISSRPREAEGLDEALGARRVELGGYGDELEEAVRRHVSRFYERGSADGGLIYGASTRSAGGAAAHKG